MRKFLRKSSLLLVVLWGVGCAKAHPPLPDLVLLYGTAYQRCADPGDQDNRIPHSHLTFRAYAPEALPQDVFVFRDNGRVMARLSPGERGGLVSLEFPAGYGAHNILVSWLRDDKEMRPPVEGLVSVWECRR